MADSGMGVPVNIAQIQDEGYKVSHVGISASEYYLLECCTLGFISPYSKTAAAASSIAEPAIHHEQIHPRHPQTTDYSSE